MLILSRKRDWYQKQISVTAKLPGQDHWDLVPVLAQLWGDTAVYKMRGDPYWSVGALKVKLVLCYFKEEEEAKCFAVEAQRVAAKALRQRQPDLMRKYIPPQFQEWLRACYQGKKFCPYPALSKDTCGASLFS